MTPSPSGAPDPLLEVRDLRKRFRSRRGGDVFAVDGLDLHVAPGEFLGLVGESGCGKSTTARLVLRLLEPDGGDVVWKGRSVPAMGPAELRAFRREVQIVFQDPAGSLNPRHTVERALEEVLAVHRMVEGRRGRRQRVRELLERVGLDPDDSRRHPHQFSGGQRQRVAIARALAVEPDLLVLDEPVSALDVSEQARVLELLETLRRELGLTCLLIAHDLSVVRRSCDRVAVMYRGRLVEEGPVDAVFDAPAHPCTRGLLAAARTGRFVPSALPQGDPSRPGGAFPDPAETEGGCPFHPRCPHPQRDAACRAGRPPMVEIPHGTGHRAACIKVETSPRKHP